MDIRRNLDGERENDRGKEPARKELKPISTCQDMAAQGNSRNCHDNAQGEQHEEAVQHLSFDKSLNPVTQLFEFSTVVNLCNGKPLAARNCAKTALSW